MIASRASGAEPLEAAVRRELEAGPATFAALARRLTADGDPRPLLEVLENLARAGRVELDESGEAIRARRRDAPAA
ncbi:MAG: hypothetical protein F9K18_09530 [Thermoanaerobaculia bacterium]|nr:MAG: hypothetical protein F9K18_09530 [Thermoanaerobaculia bacterium]